MGIWPKILCKKFCSQEIFILYSLHFIFISESKLAKSHFPQCILSFTYMFFKVHYVVACINISFLYIVKQYFIVLICGTFWLSIHQVTNIWVISAFLLLMNNAATNLHVQVFIWAYVFFSLGYTSRRGSAGSFGNYV